MRRWIIFGVLSLGAAIWLRAHTVYSTKITWSRDISRIVYHNCAGCHHPGGSSFSLMTFKEARPWAEAIKLQVLERRMPPWNAVKGFGDFKDDHGLTQEDLEIIGEWVDGGEPEGDPQQLPRMPFFDTEKTKTSEIGHRTTISGNTSPKHFVEAIGITPNRVPPEGLQVVARHVNGSIDPLIWIEQFNPDYNQTYYFRHPLRFPAGTRIEVTPPQGSVTLFVK